MVNVVKYTINHIFNCNDKYSIYLLTYNTFKLQYVGNSVDDFRL